MCRERGSYTAGGLIVGRHRKSATTKWGPYVTTGIALEAATLFAFTYATDCHVALNPLLTATTSIFVDGTKSMTGNEEGISPYRMTGSLGGAYDQSSVDPNNNEFVVYPRSLGLLTGLGDPTYDASEGEATAKTVAAVKAARTANGPNATIYVVGYSQGAGAASQAITQLEADSQTDGVDYTKNVEFVLAADPRRNDGGILTRLPKGVYVPVLGVTFGDGTSPQSQNTKVLQVSKQYDGVADAPTYVFNVVADVNAVMGYYYLHPGYYKTIDPSTVPADDRIISTSADGRITDVLIKAPVGELPLTMPLLQLGVPRSVVEALDPFLRAVIETGYDRPVGPGSFPSEPVPFQLLPPPTRWISDAQSVAAGAAQTGQNVTGLITPPGPVVANDVGSNRSAIVSQKLDVDSRLTQQPDPPDAPNSTPMKFEPPRVSKGGWKPGDLLRHFLPPKTTTGQSSQSATTPTPEPPTAPSQEPSDPTAHATNELASAATP